MMNTQTKITGVILAGGLARRMNQQDKGLVRYHGAALITYAIAAIAPLVSQLLINANRNQDDYKQFGFPVIADQTANFDGPLAGILTAMLHCTGEILVVMPCDSPLIKSEHLQKIISTLQESKSQIAVAHDGEKLQPVFLAVNPDLKHDLQAYLNSGERKLESWIKRHAFVTVDFSNAASIFLNLNTLSELSALEKASVQS
jgi:molybdopterin-guanine dinucleotide biosynthesis protein A